MSSWDYPVLTKSNDDKNRQMVFKNRNCFFSVYRQYVKYELRTLLNTRVDRKHNTKS